MWACHSNLYTCFLLFEWWCWCWFLKLSHLFVSWYLLRWRSCILVGWVGWAVCGYLEEWIPSFLEGFVSCLIWLDTALVNSIKFCQNVWRHSSNNKCVKEKKKNSGGQFIKGNLRLLVHQSYITYFHHFRTQATELPWIYFLLKKPAASSSLLEWLSSV